ncbi:hypothetical protein [Litoreibacter roseus]|uniref:Uncharacterized protein n=1 Tax=Litoreibacter roseus TaxID=2601869 RepID=A0A6N6JG50_9RHOB|nr:hypothetical protein [Litoreibacter roseus]GFE65206.1 hypothetical protein KIN_22800 [Litoreibacter roseus]
MIRRTITLVLCGLAFYGGIEIERGRVKDRCVDAGGAWEPTRLICIGISE